MDKRANLRNYTGGIEAHQRRSVQISVESLIVYGANQINDIRKSSQRGQRSTEEELQQKIGDSRLNFTSRKSWVNKTGIFAGNPQSD